MTALLDLASAGGPSDVPAVLPLLAAVPAALLALDRAFLGTGGDRRRWLMLAGAACAWVLGGALVAVPLASAALHVAVWVLVVWHLNRLTTALQSASELRRDVLDCLLVVLAVLSVTWLVVSSASPGLGLGAVGLEAVALVVTGSCALATAVHTALRAPERGRSLATVCSGLAVLFAGLVAGVRADVLPGAADDPLAGGLAAAGWALVLLGTLWDWDERRLVVEAAERPAPEADAAIEELVGGSLLANAAAGVAALACVGQAALSGAHHDRVGLWLGVSALAALVMRTIAALHDIRLLNRDLEERVQERTRALADSEHRFAALVAHSSDVVAITDAQGLLLYASPPADRLLGRRLDDAVGRPLRELLHEESSDAVGETGVLAAMASGGVRHLELQMALAHADGHRVDVEAVVTNLLDDPDVRGLVINAHDVSEALRLERELSQQAFSDALTGLPNRALFTDRLQHALRSRGRRGQVKVCFLDLDGFKAVNDTLGHGAGDELLAAVAQRLLASVRQGDTVARLGGDEFAVLLDEGNREDAEDVAQRLCEAVRRPFSVRGTEVRVGTSLGLASTREAGRDAEQLMRGADLAMYQAKSERRGGFAVYHPRMHEALVERVQLEADLRRAVEEGQFRVVYQPLVDMGTGGVSGVEALVRWHHPARGVVVPADFIPLAESTGLIDAIGAFVLREACQQVAAWREDVPGAEAMRLSVNLSAHQLRDPHLLATVVQALEVSGLPAPSLVLEITESVFVGQDEEALQALDALRELGVRLAIDDFGTGYSSLSYLHRLPVDIIKIDKSFVDRLSDSDDTSLVDAILSMASTLGMTTVAEGVEHEHQRSALAAQGCATGQGYHFSPPVEAGLLPELVVSALLAQTGTAGAAPAPAPAPRAASPRS